jgi:toxin ParE1/3/4
VKRPVVFTPGASNDLVELYDYIAAQSSPERAMRYILRIERTCTTLENLPERGTLRADIRPGLRVMGFERRVLIAFQVKPDSVAILRILYGGRNLEQAFS